MIRQIVHVDLDAFFVSVERLLNPSLVDKPVIVGGSPTQRGVVSSASYEARACGVRSAMPMGQAMRLCPEAIRVAPRHGVYSAHSRAVMALLAEYSPVVEQVSIDEAFLDLTGTEGLHGPAANAASTIQRRVRDELGLPCSLGVATNKLVAKMACSLGKPRGLVVVEPGHEAAFLAPLPIEALWGVGEATGGRLRTLGIDTVGSLAEWPLETLRELFGASGVYLYQGSHGIDDSPVSDARVRKSYSHEETFPRDTADAMQVRRTLLWMADQLSARLRADRVGAQTVRLKLRTGDYSTSTRQTRLESVTDQSSAIYAAALGLLAAAWRHEPLRLIGLGVADLVPGGGRQLDLFGRDDQRDARLSQALDSIRERFGPQAISRASLAGLHRGHQTGSGTDQMDD